MVFYTVASKNLYYLIAHNFFQIHLPALNVLGLQKIVGRYIFKIKTPKTVVKEEISRSQKD